MKVTGHGVHNQNSHNILDLIFLKFYDLIFLNKGVKKVTVCNCLREVRLRLGYTQEEVFEITNISRQYISAVERGALVPSLKNAIILSKALGKYHEDLFM